MTYSKLKPSIIIKYLSLIFGTLMLIIAFYFYKSITQFIENSIETQGTVVELIESRSSRNSILYKPLVKFTDDKGTKIKFLSATSSNPPSYSVNEKVQVIYNPESPNKAKIKSFFSIWGVVIILGIFVLLCFTIGGIFFIKDLNKNKMLKYLKQNGTKIETDFQKVSVNTSYSFNGKKPFTIVSRWQNPQTSELHFFTSSNIWFDPTDFITTDKIQVIIDEKKPKRYLVDLSFLPKIAN